MLHKKKIKRKLDSVLGLERWGGMFRGYFGIATLTLIIEVNTSPYFRIRKKISTAKPTVK